MAITVKVRQILDLLEQGVPQSEIARKFGISRQRVNYIAVTKDRMMRARAKRNAHNVAFLRVHRVGRGMSQAELASAAGVNISTVWSAEAGKFIRRQAAEAIAKALGFEVTELFDLDYVVR